MPARPPAQRTIEIDLEVWEALQAMAKPFVDKSPNDVLRRLVLDGAMKSLMSAKPARNPGALLPAIEQGSIRPGDQLICEQPRRKRTFRAEVTSDGWIRVTEPDVGEFAKPSPALTACTGAAINGWGYWMHERTRRPLQTFRD